MKVFVALLRAVNVGGTGKLPMSDLRAMCEDAGFVEVRTYIASGNVVFESDQTASQVKDALERRLLAYAGKPVAVLVRTGAEMAQVLADNPFPQAAPNRTMAIFLDAPPPADVLETARRRVDEEIVVGRREIYIHYGDGMGSSKLQLKAAAAGTARNMNTVAKLAEMAAEREN